jgi:hypothetical protein
MASWKWMCREEKRENAGAADALPRAKRTAYST